jgi:hypothetical protein
MSLLLQCALPASRGDPGVEFRAGVTIAYELAEKRQRFWIEPHTKLKILATLLMFGGRWLTVWICVR